VHVVLGLYPTPRKNIFYNLYLSLTGFCAVILCTKHVVKFASISYGNKLDLTLGSLSTREGVFINGLSILS